MHAVQDRTVAVLARGRSRVEDDGLVPDLRRRLESRLRDAGLRQPIRLSKARLNSLARCEGSLAADLAGERGEFEYGFRAAVGALVHRAVQADVASERSVDARTLVDHALARELADDRFVVHWAGLEDVERHEILAEAARQFAVFREMFAPFERAAQPLSELPLKVRLLDGHVSLLGRPDLVLGRPPGIALDFKTGDPHPEHVEDGRFYALLLSLMFSRPASLVATAYLDSLELQPEEVEPHVLERAADRVVEAVRFAARLEAGTEPVLRPGAWCRWCPRAQTCPASEGGR